MAQFDREGGIDSTTIVMLGNSLTENGKDWAERIGTTKNVVNRGIIGDNTVGMKERLYQITQAQGHLSYGRYQRHGGQHHV